MIDDVVRANKNDASVLLLDAPRHPFGDLLGELPAFEREGRVNNPHLSIISAIP